MMNLRTLIAAAVTVALSLAGTAQTAAATAWTGGAAPNNDWTNLGNWSAGVPGATDTWNLTRTTSAYTYTIDLNGSDVTFGSLTQGDGSNTNMAVNWVSTGGVATIHFNTMSLKTVNIITDANVNLDGGTIAYVRKNSNSTFNGNVKLSGLVLGPGEIRTWFFYGGAQFDGGVDLHWFEINLGDVSPKIAIHSKAATVGGPGLTLGDGGQFTVYNDGATLAVTNLTLKPNGYLSPVTYPAYLDNQSTTPATVSGTLAGNSGYWKGSLEVLTGGHVAPGQSGAIGTLAGDAASGKLIIDSGASYDWQIANADGDNSAGADWDLLSASDITFDGAWTFNASELDLIGTPDGKEFVVAQVVDSFIGFDPGNVTVVTPGGWGSWSLALSGDGKSLLLSQAGPAGDTNSDGVVDAADFITLKKNFGGGEGGDATVGNFDKTGTVDWADLNTLTTHFGTGGGLAPAMTPEPATLGLLAFGALTLLRRRRA
jgi:hypothetical protein